MVSLRIDFCNESVWELLVGGDYIEKARVYVQFGNSAHNGLWLLVLGLLIELWKGGDLHISWMSTGLGVGMVVGSIVLLKLGWRC